ncbi:unnamed protein product [Periconia digitata]|uniref:Hepcidin n=1 Tax=Periconia digitata TaxID=1303443 RepID=A0A9W4XQN8_9PLEO|nr:unnamed protein product [Periconia digitata]
MHLTMRLTTLFFLAAAAAAAPTASPDSSLNPADFPNLPEGITVDNLPPGTSPNWPVVLVTTTLERRHLAKRDCACYCGSGSRCCTVCSNGCGGNCTVICGNDPSNTEGSW